MPSARPESTIYRGRRIIGPQHRAVGIQVTVGGRHLSPRLSFRNHSPTGFEWGYSGSGWRDQWSITAGEIRQFVLEQVARTGHGEQRKCRECGCTDDDCRQCIAATGQPCCWVEEDLCSRCADVEDAAILRDMGGPA